MLSNGLRSHGIIEESEEIRMDKESIVLGSGDLYCTDFQGTNEAIPDDTVIETEDNRLGHIKGGAEIEYAPEFYEAKDDMPYYPRQDKKGEIPYTILTRPEKLVMDYCHINIYEVQEMEIDIYLFFLREAMIFENSQTEEGRKYLKDCFRMEQTKPDREGLRERFGKKGGKSSG